MNLGMSENLDMDTKVDLADTFGDDGVWTFDPNDEGRTGSPYLETRFSQPTWVTALKLTPLQEELINQALTARLEVKTSEDQDDWSLLGDWQVTLGETKRLPRDPRIEVILIRLTLLSTPYHTNKRQFQADYFGCTLGGKYTAQVKQ